jgi:hypothetical protein
MQLHKAVSLLATSFLGLLGLAWASWASWACLGFLEPVRADTGALHTQKYPKNIQRTLKTFTLHILKEY